MKYCLCLKYRDYAAFRKELHSTQKFPVEDGTGKNYPSRLFWGAELVEVNGKKYYFGCNVLGKLLAQLRENRGYLHYALPEDMHLFGKPINKDSIRNLMSRFELCFLFTPCNKRTTLNGRFIKLPNP